MRRRKHRCSGVPSGHRDPDFARSDPHLPLRANIDETVPPVIISEQGENRNQCEEQRNVFGFSHGFARR
jgi:hypothetical protein